MDKPLSNYLVCLYNALFFGDFLHLDLMLAKISWRDGDGQEFLMTQS